MASTIIHLAVAKKVREKIKINNERDYYLGSIAPDLAKQIGTSRIESHFLINTKEDTPNLKIFKKRYPTYPSSNSVKADHPSTILGCWVINHNFHGVKKGNQIIDQYHLDLSIFYEEFIVPKTTIKEIPVDKLDILINKMGLLIENSKEEKTYTLDIYSITNFIDKTANRILNELKNTSIMNN